MIERFGRRFWQTMKDLEAPFDGGDEFEMEDAEIERAMRQAGRDAAIRHKREGTPIVSWEDGKVVSIAPEQIVIPPAEDSEG